MTLEDIGIEILRIQKDLDQLRAMVVSFHSTYEDALKELKTQTDEKKKLRTLVWERIISGSVWASLGVIWLAMWHYLKDQVK